jgi:hypothetical protein
MCFSKKMELIYHTERINVTAQEKLEKLSKISLIFSVSKHAKCLIQMKILKPDLPDLVNQHRVHLPFDH